MKPTVATMLVLAGLASEALSAEQGIKDVGANTYTITVEAGAADVTLNEDDVKALGSDVTLVKMGKGRLVVETDLRTAGYDGEILIKEGYFRGKTGWCLGGKNGKTVISNGATLEYYDTARGWDSPMPPFGEETVWFEGSGVDNCGAIYAVNSAGHISTDMMFASSPCVKMTGDATVGYSGAQGYDGTFGLRNVKCFDMGGHTLTILKGSNSGFFGVYGGAYDWQQNPAVVNPGHIVVKSACGKFTFENQNCFAGDAENTFTVETGVNLVFKNQPSETLIPWTLIVAGDISMQSSTAAGTGNGWYGPIQLNGTLTFNGNASAARFDGKITGTGGITFASGAFKMTGSNNASKTNEYAGVTLVKNGATLTVESMALVPADHGRLVAEGGAHVVYSSSPEKDMTATAERAMDANMSVTTNSAYNIETTDVVINYLGPIDAYSDPLVGPMTFTSCFSPSAGFSLASTLSGGVGIRQNAGTKLTVTTGGEAGMLQTYGGAIDIAAGAYVDIQQNGIYSDGAYPDVGRISVHGTVVQADGTEAINAGRSVTTCGSTSRGIIELFNGSIVTGRVERNSSDARAARAQGAYYLHGGTLYTSSSSEHFPADGRCAYFSIEAGARYIMRGTSRVAREGTAVYHVRGGEFRHFRTSDSAMNTFNVGVGGGTGDILVDNGGQMVFENTIFSLGRAIEAHENPNLGRKLSMCIDGEGSLAAFDTLIEWVIPQLACCNEAVSSLGVMNGGAVRSSTFQKPAEGFAGRGDSTMVPLVDTHAIVAFDDGTYQTGWNFPDGGQLHFKLFQGFAGGVDHVLVYSGGMTVRNDGYDNYKIGAALEAPTGNGIGSIELPDEIKALGAWAYIAAPRVQIDDPTGLGAAAIAIFDTTSGFVTGIKVTCPGIGYTDPEVTISYGGYTGDFKFKTGIVMVPNASGGFTKTGSKSVVMDVASTYTGVTTVEEGTLKLGVDDAIKCSSGVYLSGGVLDVDEKAFDRPILGGCGAIVNVGHALTTGTTLSFKGVDLASKKALSSDAEIALASGAVVSLDDLAPLVASGKHTFTLMTSAVAITGNLPELDRTVFTDAKWHMYLTADRKSLKLNDGTGMMLIVH